MTKRNFTFSIVLAAAAVTIAGCDGLGKMAKNASQVTYTVTPNPLEMHGDSVAVTIDGKYPPKYFNKKVAVSLTPVLKHSGGETPFKTVSYKGEQATAEGTVIPYNEGGTFSYTDKIAYTPEMKVSELHLKAVGSKGSKTKEFPSVKLADGVITTPLLVMADDKPTIGADKFTKTQPRTSNADIHFLVNQADVRSTELRQDDIKAMMEFIKTGIARAYTFNSTDISAYASPDGEETLNAGLSERRADNTEKWLMNEFKKLKVEAASQPGFFKKTNTPEDWEGFRQLMQASDIKDKDLILRVLSMYTDPMQREKEIKNMAATYEVVAKEILPKLRRSQIQINAEEKSRADEQISALATTSPDSLANEEILYAATLTNDLQTKANIYQAAERIYPEDWRTANNLGYIYLMQNRLDDAQTQFEKADKLSPNNPVVWTNMGVTAHMRGDRAKAEEYYKQAGDDPAARYNLGVLYIKTGNYPQAVSNMSGANTFNAALAKTLSGDYAGSTSIIDASPDKDSAAGYYLKAINAARQKNESAVISNLKSAVAKDASLKAAAKDDMEFAAYKNNAEFAAIVQ